MKVDHTLFNPPSSLTESYIPTPVIYAVDTWPKIRELPDGYCDAVITDPMYNLTEAEKQILLHHFTRIARDWVIIFMPPENQFVKESLSLAFEGRWVKYQELFWIKPMSSKNTSKSYARYVETIQVYKLHDDAYWGNDRHYSQYMNVFQDRVDSTEVHNWRKPPAIIETLLLNHVPKWGTVFDPFAGSGVVGEVAKRNHRWYNCWDIEAKNINLQIENSI